MTSHGAKQHAETRACNSIHRIPGAGDKPERRWTWKRCYRNDIDDIVVDRLVAGEHVNGTRYERMEAVRRLHRQGMRNVDIRQRLGVNERMVDRDLADLGLAKPRNLQATKDRRICVERLVRAGCRRREIAVLLAVNEKTIGTDLQSLGKCTGLNRKPIRSRSELLATYGHLLTGSVDSGFENTDVCMHDAEVRTA